METSFFSSELLEEFEQADAEYQHAPQPSLDEATGIRMELDTDDPELMDTSSGDDNTPPVRAEEDEVEERRIDEFISKTCECHYGPNKAGCSVLFPRELIAATRMYCLEMTKPELDLVVIANLEANRRASDVEGVPRVHIDYRCRRVGCPPVQIVPPDTLH